MTSAALTDAFGGRRVVADVDDAPIDCAGQSKFDGARNVFVIEPVEWKRDAALKGARA